MEAYEEQNQSKKSEEQQQQLESGFQLESNEMMPYVSGVDLSPDESDDRFDDEKTERIINEELQKLVLDQVLSENRGKNAVKDEEENEEGSMDKVGDDHGRDQGGENDYEYRGTESENGNDNESEDSGVAKEGNYGSNTSVDDNGNRRKRTQYPLRLDADDCAFYMKTGSCKFGPNCKFNHPPRRKIQGAREKMNQRQENLERTGQIECKYYLTSGGCRYGKACKYNHSKEKSPVAAILEFNFLGLPIRPGEKECPYYMRNGSCKYGSNCRFHHPDPTMGTGGDLSSRYNDGGSLALQGASSSTVSSWSSQRTLNDTAPFIPVMFQPSQGIAAPNLEWNQAPVYQTSEKSLPTPPAFAMSNAARDVNSYKHQQPMLVEEYPERPGQPECTFYLKTGDCKYKSNCKFHHPKPRTSRTSSCALSDKGLPLRPDQAICSHYKRYGICKFGPACKFDHPENFGNLSSPGSGFDQPPFGNSATADAAR